MKKCSHGNTIRRFDRKQLKDSRGYVYKVIYRTITECRNCRAVLSIESE